MADQEDPLRSLAGSPETARADRNNTTVTAPKGFLAIVFTDIQDSTALWEEIPVAMQEAIRIHDELLRANAREFSGYEVKAIGDAFMVAFETAKSALQFCLRVQTDLIAADWPDQILQSKYGKAERDGEYNLIRRGLSVRMAIHWGEPLPQMNCVTGRVDYIGPMVHRVSRAIDVADGGQIVVTESFVNELEGAARGTTTSRPRSRSPLVHPKGLGMGLNGEEMEDGLPQARSRGTSPAPGPSSSFMPQRPRQQAFAVKDAGEHRLKGLSTPLHLYMMVPASLSSRLKSKQIKDGANGQSWFEWAREGLGSNASEQNILPL